MNVYILTILRQANDSYYPDYEYVYGVYSTREKAEEAANNLQHKHESMHSDYLDLISGWKITECAVDPDEGNIGTLLNAL